ncbi:hypothetical protein SD70_30050 [Gordoniibacillus kamchatkensis]|uniref:Uncharacterized protein n=1 Tax=Gordoniibacillus kamchatkensis TaxID=1590651 RepID=A0ABR5AA54_9BACL|nr:hypothetical protein [Paenibacillus sp. VKM B-2647]KIL37888.1 hypothetical protein SD70_30050 [Paenibacillus sp. VKM B-2647]
MQLLCQYPIAASSVTPYIGRAVAACTADGDVVCGVIDRIHDGHLVMRPLENVPDAAIASLKQSLAKNPRVNDIKSKMKEKARIKAWGYPGAYPFGWGYGNWGWGLGWWWIWPLFFLAALAAFPFFWYARRGGTNFRLTIMELPAAQTGSSIMALWARSGTAGLAAASPPFTAARSGRSARPPKWRPAGTR